LREWENGSHEKKNMGLRHFDLRTVRNGSGCGSQESQLVDKAS